MNVLDDIMFEVRRNVRALAEETQSDRAEDVILSWVTRVSDKRLEDYILPVMSGVGDAIYDLRGRELDSLIMDIANGVSASLVFSILDNTRELDNASGRLVRELEKTMTDLDPLLNPRVSDRSSYARSNRSDGPSRSNRGSNGFGGRHINRYERDRPEPREELREEPRRRSIREPREELRRPSVEEKILSTAPTKLTDGVTITRKNVSLVPVDKHIEIPYYYAGVESLVYVESTDSIEPVVIVGDEKVNYEEHRTDVLLNARRKPRDIAKNVEMLEREATKAAAKVVSAFVETGGDAADDDKVEELAVSHIVDSCIVDGIYNINERVIGHEVVVKDILRDMLGDTFDNNVVGVTVNHIMFKPDDDLIETPEWMEFIKAADVMKYHMTMESIAQILDLAAGILDDATYNDIHDLLEQSSFAAISRTTGTNFSSDDFINDIPDIIKFIEGRMETSPDIWNKTNDILTGYTPSIMADDNGVFVTRNYIFLPIDSNDVTIASPLGYASITKEGRSELYNLINGLMKLNKLKVISNPLNTIVTSDNVVFNVVTYQPNLMEDPYLFILKPMKR